MSGQHYLMQKNKTRTDEEILKLIKAGWHDRNIGAYLQVRFNRVAKIRKEYYKKKRGIPDIQKLNL